MASNESASPARASWSGKWAFILAGAASAVGLGNMWRFPYLAAKFGGGTFLLTYLVLVATFGLSLLLLETALGRHTRQSVIGAFSHFGKKYIWIGILAAVVPFIITPYYCIIGGWVTKYMVAYITNGPAALADGGTFFTGFISSNVESYVWMLIFMALVFFVVALGVQGGIEKANRIMMPALIVMAVAIAIFTMTMPGALDGVAYYLVPDFSKFSPDLVINALGQMFYSLSLAMGIMVTYGSYMQKENLLEHSVAQIEIFDTLFAFVAGLMIIPAVIAFNGGDPSQVNSGPGLMFITLPMVFDSMKFGTIIGAVFFLLVLFAALTSSISLMETLVSVLMDKAHMKRKTATIAITASCLIIGMLSCLGYGPWATITIIGMQFLDFFDFISNSVLMPIVALLTCILIGHVVGTKVIADEVKEGAGSFHREKLHRVMVRWVAPVMLAAILASELATKVFHLFTI